MERIGNDRPQIGQSAIPMAPLIYTSCYSLLTDHQSNSSKQQIKIFFWQATEVTEVLAACHDILMKASIATKQ
jgi:hypothetical protein